MAIMRGNSASAGFLLLAVAALSCRVDARDILSVDFEDCPLGSPGIVCAWGSGNHWAYVTNVKSHGGEKSVVWASGFVAGEQATAFNLLPKETPGRDDVLKGDYLRVRYWYWPDTDTTGFWTELRTNLGRPLMWYTGPDFKMNAGWKPKEQRRISDFVAQKRQQTGGWHRITVDIPLQADLNARMEVVYPDGSSEKGESDYDYKLGTVSFTWMPIFNQWASRARMFLDDITVTAISRDEKEGEKAVDSQAKQ